MFTKDNLQLTAQQAFITERFATALLAAAIVLLLPLRDSVILVNWIGYGHIFLAFFSQRKAGKYRSRQEMLVLTGIITLTFAFCFLSPGMFFIFVASAAILHTFFDDLMLAKVKATTHYVVLVFIVFAVYGASFLPKPDLIIAHQSTAFLIGASAAAILLLTKTKSPDFTIMAYLTLSFIFIWFGYTSSLHPAYILYFYSICHYTHWYVYIYKKRQEVTIAHFPSGAKDTPLKGYLRDVLIYNIVVLSIMGLSYLFFKPVFAYFFQRAEFIFAMTLIHFITTLRTKDYVEFYQLLRSGLKFG